MATERIRIIVSEDGARKVKRRIKDIGTAATGAERASLLLRRTLGALGLAAIARGVLRTADAFQNMQNQIRLVTQSTRQLNVVTDELLRIANGTRSALEGTAKVYTRVTRNAKALGVSQREALDFTESLNQAIILSGSNTQESAAGVLQLSQALGKGILNGDELRSVLENTAEVAQVIARGMGVPVGALKELGRQGKITAQDIIRSFKEAREELAERFAKTVPTMGQAVQVLSNTWTVFLGRLDQTYGVSRRIAQAILFVSGHLDTMKDAAVALGYVLLVHLAVRAIPAVIVGLKTMAVWLAANPIIALTQVLLVSTAVMLAFSRSIKVSTDGLVTMHDVFVALSRRLNRGLNAIGNWFRETFFSASLSSAKATDDMIDDHATYKKSTAEQLDELLSAWKGYFLGLSNAANATWNGMVDGVRAVFRVFQEGFSKDSVGDLFTPQGVSINQQFKRGFEEAARNPVTAFRGVAAESRSIAQARRLREQEEFALNEAALAGLNNPVGPPQPLVQKESGKQKATFAELFADLQREAQLVGLTNRELEKRQTLYAFEDQLGRGLDPDTEAALVAEVIALKQRRQVLADLTQPHRDFVDGMAQLKEIQADHPELINEINQAMLQLNQTFLQSQNGGGFAEGYARQIQMMVNETQNATTRMGTQFANLFGPTGTLITGISDAIAQTIVFGDRFDQALKKIGQSILVEVISALIQTGIQMAINAAQGRALQAAATTATVAQAATVGAAWATPAALANTATSGAAASSGAATLASTVASAKGLAAAGALGFRNGGYTGNMPEDQVAGVTHGREFVLNAAATRRIGRANLERMNSGGGGQAPNITVINADVPAMEFEVNQLSAQDVEIIAKRVVAQDAPKVVAADTRRANGHMARAITQRTNAKVKRA